MHNIKALTLSIPLFLILAACQDSTSSGRVAPSIDSSSNQGGASVDSDESWQSGTQEDSSIGVNMPNNSSSLAIDSDVNWSSEKDIENGEVVTGKTGDHYGSTPNQAIDSDSSW
jgi:hypothetical protein